MAFDLLNLCLMPYNCKYCICIIRATRVMSANIPVLLLISVGVYVSCKWGVRSLLSLRLGGGGGGESTAQWCNHPVDAWWV